MENQSNYDFEDIFGSQLLNTDRQRRYSFAKPSPLNIRKPISLSTPYSVTERRFSQVLDQAPFSPRLSFPMSQSPMFSPTTGGGWSFDSLAGISPENSFVATPPFITSKKQVQIPRLKTSHIAKQVGAQEEKLAIIKKVESETLETITIREIKTILRNYGKNASGKKSVLFERVKDLLAEWKKEFPQLFASQKAISQSQEANIVNFLDSLDKLNEESFGNPTELPTSRSRSSVHLLLNQNLKNDAILGSKFNERREIVTPDSDGASPQSAGTLFQMGMSTMSPEQLRRMSLTGEIADFYNLTF